MRDGVFVVEIYIDRRDKEVNRALYDQLQEDKEEFEAELGDVTWGERPNKQSFRIRTAERDIPGKPAKLSEDEEDKIVEGRLTQWTIAGRYSTHKLRRWNSRTNNTSSLVGVEGRETVMGPLSCVVRGDVLAKVRMDLSAERDYSTTPHVLSI